MEDPQWAALVIALRDEVSREVRPAMFHDESSLIGELSTGPKLNWRSRAIGRAGCGPPSTGRQARCSGWRRGHRPWLAGRNCWPSWARLASGEGTGPRVVASRPWQKAGPAPAKRIPATEIRALPRAR